MKKNRVVSLIFAVSILLTTAQTAFALFIDKEPTDPKIPIKAKRGQNITINLESNRTTGYEWQIDKPLDEKIVKFTKSKYIGYRKVTFVGAGGIEKWFFKAVGKGKTTISFKYVRSWEQDVPPLRTAVFTVIVK